MPRKPDAKPVTVRWDRPMLERFKVAVLAADDLEGDAFVFEDNEYAKSYAAYLVEYLEPRL